LPSEMVIEMTNEISRLHKRLKALMERKAKLEAKPVASGRGRRRRPRHRW